MGQEAHGDEMIWDGPRLLAGRLEQSPTNYRWAWDILSQYQALAQHFRRRLASWDEFWPHWNVVGLQTGHYVDFMRYEELGRHPAPWLTTWWRYDVNRVKMREVCVPTDPPVLHGSTRLVDTTNSPADLGQLPGREHEGVWQRVRAVEEQMRRLNVLGDWRSQTREGLETVLQRRGWALAPDDNLTYKLVPWTRTPTPPPVANPSRFSLIDAELHGA